MVAVDSSGDLYIADGSNNRIRKVSKTTGIITTIAGTGQIGYNGDNIAATSAILTKPTGIAVDLIGDVYISVSNNHRLRVVSKKTGNITTIAGNGVATFSGENLQSTLSSMNYPLGIAFDASRNIYFSDYGNHRIRMINIITGIITTVAGNGNSVFNGDNVLASTASISYPRGICFDKAGNLYIADHGNHRIRMVTKNTGIITTVAGTGTQGYNGDLRKATSAHLNWPSDITFDASGNLYIADTFNYRIRMITMSTGNITTIVGNGLKGDVKEGEQATLTPITECFAVAVNSLGDFYVSDRGSNKVLHVKLRDGSTVPTSMPTNPTTISTPMPSRPPAVPTSTPTGVPTCTPSAVPTSIPSGEPTSIPSAVPTSAPSAVPTYKPSALPTCMPSAVPTCMPSGEPTSMPSAIPTCMPSGEPTFMPSAVPTSMPSVEPTSMPSAEPTSMPSAVPTSMPSAIPTSMPSAVPTSMPSSIPTSKCNVVPTCMPSAVPTCMPSVEPTSKPSAVPTSKPSAVPSSMPSAGRTSKPSAVPTSKCIIVPISKPSAVPTCMPSAIPTSKCKIVPTSKPSVVPKSK